jgi:CubicO group peptidase (beta-lactamase class C family)
MVVSHYRELVPTRVVSRGQAPIVPLTRAERGGLDAVTFTTMGGTAASGLLPRRPGDTGPSSTLAYLAGLKKAYAHGERFTYKTVNTDSLAAVVRRVTRKPLATLLSERFHARLGTGHDAYFLIDSTGVEFAGGGLNLTLRDLARYGEMVRLDGRLQGQQIVGPERHRRRPSGRGSRTLCGRRLRDIEGMDGGGRHGSLALLEMSRRTAASAKRRAEVSNASVMPTPVASGKPTAIGPANAGTGTSESVRGVTAMTAPIASTRQRVCRPIAWAAS